MWVGSGVGGEGGMATPACTLFPCQGSRAMRAPATALWVGPGARGLGCVVEEVPCPALPCQTSSPGVWVCRRVVEEGEGDGVILG